MTEAPALEITDLIICEDVRYELNSKMSLIGLFSGNILLAQFPATGVRVCVYIGFHVHAMGDFPFAVEIQYSGKSQFRLEGGIVAQSLGPAGTSTPQFNLALPEEGDLEITVKFESPSIASRSITRRVTKGDIVSPFGPPP